MVVMQKNKNGQHNLESESLIGKNKISYILKDSDSICSIILFILSCRESESLPAFCLEKDSVVVLFGFAEELLFRAEGRFPDLVGVADVFNVPRMAWSIDALSPPPRLGGPSSPSFI